ncbi:MAG: hypothetical protein IKJ76_04565, partial [Fibrobacter sp.]|nr:hypothetical protein [Fibrobacter sp.]
MVLFAKYIAGFAIALVCMGLCSCTFPVRTGYDRSIGGYKSAPSEPTSTAKAESGTRDGASTTKSPSRAPTNKHTTAGATKQAATQKMAHENAPKQASNSSLEKLAQSWIGTR